MTGIYLAVLVAFLGGGLAMACSVSGWPRSVTWPACFFLGFFVMFVCPKLGMLV